MAAERLFAGDPYNEKHITLLEQFEQETNRKTKSLQYLEKVRSTVSKEEYGEWKKGKNEIEDCLFLEKDGSIIDCCYMEGEKDRKVCHITFAMGTKLRKRKLLPLTVDYAFQTLGMEEVFVNIKKGDTLMEKSLQEQGFESLGDELGKTIYLKEKEYNKENERVLT